MLHQNFGAFFQACRNLSFYVHENDLEAKFGELNPEEAGIMLASDGENLTCKIVSGKDRPEVMCATLFGGMTMMRPYMEDFWERSEADFMSFEEKIEAVEAGDEYVMENLANLYLNGDDDVEANPEQAGTTEDDYNKAFELATKSAEQDNGDGIWALALCYANIDGQ